MPKKKLISGVFFIVLFSFFALFSAVNAQSEDVELSITNVGVKVIASVDNSGVDVVRGNDIVADEELKDVVIEEVTKIPSNWGLFWRGIKEKVSIITTFDHVKKAGKQLRFAEERMKIADFITEKSEDPKMRRKADKMIDQAQKFMDHIEKNKDKWISKENEKAGKLLRNVATHQIRREAVLDRIESKLSEDQIERFQEIREKTVASSHRLLNAIDNDKVPEEVRDHLRNVKTRIEEHAEGIKQFKEQKTQLLKDVATGDQDAKTKLKELFNNRKNKVKQSFVGLKQKKDVLLESAKQRDENVQEKLKDIKQKEEILKEKVEEKKEVVKEKRNDLEEKAFKSGKKASEKLKALKAKIKKPVFEKKTVEKKEE